jgi:hypothetical protein
MSAADQQIPDDTRVVLEELITETRRRLANTGMDNGTQLYRGGDQRQQRETQ